MSSDSDSFTSESGSIEDQLVTALEHGDETAIGAAAGTATVAAAQGPHGRENRKAPPSSRSQDSSCGFNAESPDEDRSLSDELETQHVRNAARERSDDGPFEVQAVPERPRLEPEESSNNGEDRAENSQASADWAINSPYVESIRPEGREFELRSMTRQLRKKAARRGFDFKLMLVGESGIGKTTLIDSLFNVESTRNLGSQFVRSQRDTAKTTKLCERFFELEEGGVAVRLTVIDTPGFATELDSTSCIQPVLGYVERQLDEFYRLEQGVDRTRLHDGRVHALLYLVSPSGRGLKPIDVMCLKALHTRVNVVPVIGKADTLTPGEKASLKAWVAQDLTRHGITVYTLPEFNDCFGHPDQSEDDFYLRNQYESLKSSMPLAVVGSNLQVQDADGRWTRAREYPWGIVDIDNPEYSDFLKLRELLIMYMEDFKDRTHDVIYEQIRLNRLRQTDWQLTRMTKTIADTERLLREKDDELRRLREAVELAQRSNKSSSLPTSTFTEPPSISGGGSNARAAAAVSANSDQSIGGGASSSAAAAARSYYGGPSSGVGHHSRNRGGRYSQYD